MRRSDEELTDELGEALDRLRRRQPCEERQLLGGDVANVRELKRRGLVVLRPNMTATVRKYARTGRPPTEVVKQYWLTGPGERALAAWREARRKKGRERG